MDHLILLLETYKYLIILPLAILEGPILAIIIGFLITLNFFNPVVAFLILTLGDVIGDSAMYLIGRWGGKPFLLKFGPHVGVTEEKLENARIFFDERHTKAVVLSKLIHGVGFVGLITAGILKVPYRRFALTCLVISIAQIAILLVIGYLFGHAYELLSKYLDIYTAVVSTVALISGTTFIYFKIKRA
jgi:membrane protein DedA with SNARE-associated domain